MPASSPCGSVSLALLQRTAKLPTVPAPSLGGTSTVSTGSPGWCCYQCGIGCELQCLSTAFGHGAISPLSLCSDAKLCWIARQHCWLQDREAVAVPGSPQHCLAALTHLFSSSCWVLAAGLKLFRREPVQAVKGCCWQILPG